MECGRTKRDLRLTNLNRYNKINFGVGCLLLALLSSFNVSEARVKEGKHSIFMYILYFSSKH